MGRCGGKLAPSNRMKQMHWSWKRNETEWQRPRKILVWLGGVDLEKRRGAVELELRDRYSRGDEPTVQHACVEIGSMLFGSRYCSDMMHLYGLFESCEGNLRMLPYHGLLWNEMDIVAAKSDLIFRCHGFCEVGRESKVTVASLLFHLKLGQYRFEHIASAGRALAYSFLARSACDASKGFLHEELTRWHAGFAPGSLSAADTAQTVISTAIGLVQELNGRYDQAERMFVDVVESSMPALVPISAFVKVQSLQTTDEQGRKVMRNVEWLGVNHRGLHVVPGLVFVRIAELKTWSASPDGKVVAVALKNGDVLHFTGIKNGWSQHFANLIGIAMELHFCPKEFFRVLRLQPISQSLNAGDPRVQLNSTEQFCEDNLKKHTDPQCLQLISQGSDAGDSCVRSNSRVQVFEENTKEQPDQQSCHEKSLLYRGFRMWRIGIFLSLQGWRLVLMCWQKWIAFTTEKLREKRELGQSAAVVCLEGKIRSQVLKKSVSTWEKAWKTRKFQSVCQRSSLRQGFARWKTFVMMLRYLFRIQTIVKVLEKWCKDSRKSELRNAFETLKSFSICNLLFDATARLHRRVHLRSGFESWKRFMIVRMAEYSFGIQVFKAFFAKYCSTSSKRKEAFQKLKVFSRCNFFFHSVLQLNRKFLLRIGFESWKRFVMVRMVEHSFGIQVFKEVFERCYDQNADDRKREAFQRLQRFSTCNFMINAAARVGCLIQLRSGFNAWKRFLMTKDIAQSWAIQRLTQYLTPEPARKRAALRKLKQNQDDNRVILFNKLRQCQDQIEQLEAQSVADLSRIKAKLLTA